MVGIRNCRQGAGASTTAGYERCGVHEPRTSLGRHATHLFQPPQLPADKWWYVNGSVSWLKLTRAFMQPATRMRSAEQPAGHSQLPDACRQ